MPCPNYREELLNCQNKEVYTDINTWAECDAKCDNQWDCQVWNWYGPEYSGKENTCETCIAFNGERADDNVISGQKNCTGINIISIFFRFEYRVPLLIFCIFYVFDLLRRDYNYRFLGPSVWRSLIVLKSLPLVRFE